MLEHIYGLSAKNSLDYVDKAFAILNRGGCFVNLRDGHNDLDHKGLSIEQTQSVSDTHGWYQGCRYIPQSISSIALISFTSGTEGFSKGVLISHAALANTTVRLIDVMEMDSSIREYIGIPVNYSFGFGRARAVSQVGGQFYLPENGFDPLEIKNMLERDEINAISAVPSLWRIVLESQELFSQTRNKVRWIEIGSQYMSANEKMQLKALFPQAKIVQHYGLTEASRSSFLDISNTPESKLESVGQALFGVEVAIDPENRIKIRGPHLATAYLLNGKDEQLPDEAGWFVTNDIGHIRDNYLYFDGRADDVINIGGLKVSPELLEQSLYQKLKLPEGSFCIFKIDQHSHGEQIALAFIKDSGISEQALKQELAKELKRYNITAGRIPVFSVKKIPSTDTGKIKRQELTKEFSVTASANTAPTITTDKSQQIITIWKEVLKIENISTDDSFFDLGGDSLSAIRVVMSMEKAGVPKDVCRKIFEGHSIKAIVALSSPAQPPLQNETEPTNDKAQELINIWKEVLKIETVDENDNFFDLGGDSLSAIRVSIRMEGAGISRETCRKIFEGYSIRQLVSEEPVSTPQVLEKSSSGIPDSQPIAINRTPVASANLSLNFVRGLLVLLNIVAHWMPGVLERLPAFLGAINRYFSPLYSSGTPGFAMVFGAGISFFILPRYKKNKASVGQLCGRNALLLLGGMCALAFIIVAGMYFNDLDIRPVDISNSFYSVIYYYFFAVISIPVWLKLLTWRGSFGLMCLLTSCFFYACHLWIDALNIPPSENPLIQSGILLLTAKYNYLEMSAGVLFGAGIGSFLKTYIDSGKSLSPFLGAGILMVILSIFISFETGEYTFWFVWPKGLYLWTWPFYLGCILICFYYVYRYVAQYDQSRHPKIYLVLNIVSIVGVMAFPLFIGHELVRPLAFLLGAFSVPGALAISLLLFFGYSVYLLRKLYTLYYAGSGLQQEEIAKKEI